MRATVFKQRFENLDAWSHRDVTYEDSRQAYSRGDPSALTLTRDGLQMRIVPLDLAEDGEQCYGYGYIGTEDSFTVGPGDVVSAVLQFQPGRGCHGSLWLQSKTPYGGPEDYEADIEYFGALNPWRKSGVDLRQAVHWRGLNQDFGQYTSVETKTSSVGMLGPRVPWSDDYHHHQIQIHSYGFKFLVDGEVISRIETEFTPRPMFICLSNITRDWEHEDLDQAFQARPELGPGVMTVKRLWVTRPIQSD